MNRKLFNLTLLLLLILNVSIAQRFRAGLTAGAVATDVAGSGTRDRFTHFNKLGFIAGGIVNTAINEKNIFQLEINYVQKGSLQRPDSANNDYFKLSFNYLEIPILFRRHLHFTMFKKPSNRFDLEGGLSIGRLIYSELIGNTNYTQSIDPKNFNKTDVSILAGIDYNFNSNLYFCFRYSNSVIPVTKKNPAPGPTIVYLPATFNQGNNLVFQFSVKYVFGGIETSSETKTD